MMILARVTANVVADTKIDDYKNLKIMMVQPIKPDGSDDGKMMLAVDNAQAGVGDTVIICDEGGSARMLMDTPTIMTIRTVIAGIVDSVDVDPDA
ncbi:MAG: EutN/CcmL family microcompartment protein [Phycisphaerae bacterium]|jgi:microcompartment protein CcmK/EutM|nr:EutN/CcmL family microcompartment protein [Phycisphaerae bacterium]